MTIRQSQASSNLVRWGGIAAMLGGALFATLGLIIAAMPRGCIGDECAIRQMRDTGVAGGALLILAFLLVMAGAAGLVILARRSGRFGRLGWTGLFAGAFGMALLAVGTVLNTRDSSLVPAFIILGLLALILGFLLLGVAVLLAGVLPRWVATLLIVGSLAMLGFNDQNAQALMAVPNGIAWMAVGYALWSEKGAVGRRTTSVR